VCPEVDPQNPVETTMAKKQSVSAEVQEATARLRTYHQLGMQLLKDHEPGVTRWADLQEVCERFNLAAHTIRTLRAFAATYSDADLEQLCRQCVQHDRVVGATALRHLTKFHNRRKRAQFQAKLISQGWSNTRTVAELKRELRPSWKGGRKPRIAVDLPGVLLQLQGFAISWRRWSERLADKGDRDVQVRTADLPREVRAAMEGVTGAFEALSAAVAPQQEKTDGKAQAERGQRSNATMRSRNT
jgi:hypothetical protein